MLVVLFAVEEIGNEFDDTRDTGGTADQDDFMNVGSARVVIIASRLVAWKSYDVKGEGVTTWRIERQVR